MKSPDYGRMVAMKRNVQIAHDEFRLRYGKVPQGIDDLKTAIVLSNNQLEIERLAGRFFGYLSKSLNAKTLRAKLEE
jgi:hypothetical protein